MVLDSEISKDRYLFTYLLWIDNQSPDHTILLVSNDQLFWLVFQFSLFLTKLGIILH